jgi:hypothetical protein
MWVRTAAVPNGEALSTARGHSSPGIGIEVVDVEGVVVVVDVEGIVDVDVVVVVQVCAIATVGGGNAHPPHRSEFMVTVQTPETMESQLDHDIAPGPEMLN